MSRICDTISQITFFDFEIMNLKNIVALLSGIVFLSGCANQNFKADEPVDYKDQNRYGFGSLIKNKDSVLRKYFGSNNSEDPDKIVVEKPASCSSAKDSLWDRVILSLRNFPIEFMDKKSGRIETEKVKIKQFDNTESCLYKIIITVLNDKDIDVIISSSEDSDFRLKKHAETLKKQILENR